MYIPKVYNAQFPNTKMHAMNVNTLREFKKACFKCITMLTILTTYMHYICIYDDGIRNTLR